jgi:hypothetical protein
MGNNIKIDLEGADCADEVWEPMEGFACDGDMNIGLPIRQSVKLNVITQSCYVLHGFMLEHGVFSRGLTSGEWLSRSLLRVYSNGSPTYNTI